MANELPVVGLELDGKIFGIDTDGDLSFDGHKLCIEGGACGSSGDSLAHGSEDDPYVVTTSQEFIDVMNELNNSNSKSNDNIHVNIEAGDYSWDSPITLTNGGRDENAKILIKVLDKDNSTFAYTGENNAFLQISGSFIKFTDFEITGNDKAAFIAASSSYVEMENNTCKLTDFLGGFMLYKSVLYATYLTTDTVLNAIIASVDSRAIIDGSTIGSVADSSYTSNFALYAGENSIINATGVAVNNSTVGLKIDTGGVLVGKSMNITSTKHCAEIVNGGQANLEGSTFTGSGEHNELVYIENSSNIMLKSSTFSSTGDYAIYCDNGSGNANNCNFDSAENILKALYGASVSIDSSTSDNENGKNAYLDYGSQVYALSTDFTANIDANTATLKGVFYQ
jgi:hypothetical protein